MTHKTVVYKYGTGNPVEPNGSGDVRDGIDNLQSFDVFMNAEEDTYNQRDGEVVQTVAGAIRSVGFKHGSGDFTTGFIVMPGQRNYAWYDQVSKNWYSWLGDIPASGHVVAPGTNPVGDVDWKPVTDELLRNDLSSTSGASIVGLHHGTVEDAITYVTPEMFDAPCDGISDDAPFVALALDYAVANSLPLVMNGKYLFITGVDKQYTTPVEIRGSGTITFNSFGFKLSGVPDAEIPLTAAISTFSAQTITIGSTSSFAVGDMGIIHSSTNCLSPDAGSMQLGEATGGGSPSWFGEFFEVFSKTPTVLTLATPLVFNQYPLTPKPESGARTTSTVKKVNPVTGWISGIKFIRNGVGVAVDIRYAKEFTVFGCRFNNKKLPGASVQFVYSHNSVAESCSVYLDASTPITFGTANPGNPDYYQFNAIKPISSQGCGAISCHFSNPTQTFDISYFEMPSIGCFMKTSTVIGARVNMATSHGGCYGSIFTGNTGINCWRGITCRSREDVIANNRLFGNRAYPDNPNTSGVSYGMTLTEGFTVGGTIRDNYISGFSRNIFVNNSSSRGPGFEYNRVTIANNRSAYCRHHVEIDNVVPADKSIDSGIVIQGNQFDSHEREAIVIGSYVRAAIVMNNIFLDAPTGDYYQVKTEGNCVGLQVTGNNFKDSAKTLWVQAITDPALGTNSIDGAKITCVNNITRGNPLSDSFVYDNIRPSVGNNFQTLNLGYKYNPVNSIADYTLVSDSLTVVWFAPQAGPFNLVGITGGINGREITLFNGSGTNPITLKNSATVQTATGADVPFTTNKIIRLLYLTGKWRQIE